MALRSELLDELPCHRVPWHAGSALFAYVEDIERRRCLPTPGAHYGSNERSLAESIMNALRLDMEQGWQCAVLSEQATAELSSCRGLGKRIEAHCQVW